MNFHPLRYAALLLSAVASPTLVHAQASDAFAPDDGLQGAGAGPRTPRPLDASQLRSPLDGLPVAFLENRGQWGLPAGFVAAKGPARILVQPDALTVQVRPTPGAEALPVIRFVFEGAREDARLEGAAPQGGRYNYFSGADVRAEGLTPYGEILNRDVYEGIDVRLRDAHGRLEYDVLLAPGADLTQVVVRCEGIERLELADDGRLLLHTAGGNVLEQSPPTTWAEGTDGGRRPLECRYVLLDGARYGYALPVRAEEHAVVIDPGLEWATFLGGSQGQELASVRPMSGGRVVVAGSTEATSWTPPGPGSSVGPLAATDCFVALLDPSQTGANQLVWWTFFGGTSNEWINEMVTDASDDIYTVGNTNSSDFPTTANAYDATFGGAWDGFVTQLDPATGALVHSTYYGGSGEDRGHRIRPDGGARVLFGGMTTSADLPTTPNAFDTTLGVQDAFVAVLDLAQSGPAALLYSSYVGGSGDEGSLYYRQTDVARAAGGNLVVATDTSSTDWPVTANAYQPTNSGGRDVCLVEFDPSVAGAAGLVYGTYLGGGTNEDGLRVLELDPAGRYVLGGYTYSSGFPVTPGAALPNFRGPASRNDGWLAVLDRTAPSHLVYSTFVPGDGYESVFDLVCGTDGTIFATGFSGDDAIVTTGLDVTCGAFQGAFGGPRNDNFVIAVAPNGNGSDDLRYFTYLGGNGWEVGLGIALESEVGTPVILASGDTEAADFPTTPGAAQTAIGGGIDAWIVRLRLNPYRTCIGMPNGVSADGALLCGQGSTRLADNAFDLRVTGLPTNSFGYFLMSTNEVAPFALPAPSQGVLCLGGPQVRYSAFVLNSGAQGNVAFQPDLANTPPPGAQLVPGDTAVFQYWYRDQGSASNTSNGVAVTFD